MKTLTTAFALSVSATALMAQDTREMDAHVHGVTEVKIAIEGAELSVLLAAPGMDIVGFEHAASTDADKAAVDAALALLRDPASSVVPDAAAGCTVEEAEAALMTDDHHKDAHDDHEHEAHAEAEGHDADHDHEAEHAYSEDHAEATHSAFEAQYRFVCDTPEALTTMAFPFFATFPNAEEIEAEYVTDAGAGAAEVTADAPQLVLN